MSLKELAGSRQPAARFYRDENGSRYRLLRAYDDPAVYRASGPLDVASGGTPPTITILGKADIHDCRTWEAARAALSGELLRRVRDLAPEAETLPAPRW